MLTTLGIALTLGLSSGNVRAAQVPITIIHTNDLHSHFRADKGPFGLGGVGRLATTIRRLRASTQNSLLLDGGDWSEGNIYYNLEAGRTALEVMNTLGYDATVIGNHDWLNGPDRLLQLFNQVKPGFALLAANVDATKYARSAEFSKVVQPYTILNRGGVKIAVIGVVTYELIYDRFFAPVTIKDPFGLTRRLAAKLKKEGADLVIVISHNGMATNKLIAGMPNIDIVIHAHDHVKLPEPLSIEHDGKTALMVEAGDWGKYVGKLDILFDTATKKYSVAHYELIQQDETIPEDPELVAAVNNYDRQLENIYGDIFHDHLAETKIDIRRDSSESLYGNLLTDAYREHAGADVSFEQVSLTSNTLSTGWINTVDIYDALTAIWSPITGKAWTLKTMKMTGETLTWVLNFVLSAGSYVPGGLLSVSGVHLVYDPLAVRGMNPDQRVSVPVNGQLKDLPYGGLPLDPSKRPLKLLEIGGQPVDPKREYTVAVPEGINFAMDFLETFLGAKIERRDLRDTGVEDWRILAEYLEKHSPIDTATIGRGGRITTLQPDLALYHDEITLSRDGAQVWADVTVRNLGTTASAPRTLKLSYDKTPLDTRDDPNPAVVDRAFTVPAIDAGGLVHVKVELTLPEAFTDVRTPVYFLLDEDKSDPNRSNDGTWLLVEADGRTRQTHPRPSAARSERPRPRA